ncbi:tripartite tricarboxylate transporter substrate binding protein [Siccirubricoccus sp. KC 17139]|uniref:Tripartite tricarboxylate transporter substrate binding protein n=1 Tax=Siccirubricoccus soli TaxID=2899147 RepID=A0ABT1D853_9PROT|nr:tripartite tricarboxylate transporter substrate binding protein [Siccirubricoccus soli]MCO6418119.1 tripartite tricarboxylate transporter substrate binding protein [Siccirubricoccus soli]MCP2684254.1 tripartite tricarboxylate transporter substrate binding protein [Siccirubricoccus soli]
MQMTRRAALAGLLAAPGLAPGRGQAQGAPGAGAEWPNRPIRLVIPYPPGGPTDLLGRVVAQRLTAALPQPVVAENRAGAGGSIGAEQVARAAPDGHTLLANASAHVILPHMLRLPFDAVADFAPITCIAAVPLILVVTPGLPVRNVAELVALAKAKPGQLSYASSSNGGAPHLAGEMFKLLAGVDLAHVPYRGSGQALPDLVAGNVQVMFDSLASSAALVREGRLKALAVTTERRIAGFPELPTVAEAGVPGYAITTWYGLWAPARTPAPILERVQRAVAAGVRQPEAAERFASMGAEPVAQEPAAFAAFATAEYDRYGRLVREANIRAD